MKICPKCGGAVRDDGFCGVCGERLQEGAAFCPNCGAPVKPLQKSSRKYRIIRISAVAAAVLAALLVLSVAVLPGLLRSDAENFVYYQQKLLVDPIMDAVTGGLNWALNVLNTDLAVTAHVDDPAVGTFLNNISAELKLKTEKGRMVLNAGVNFMGSPLVTGAAFLEDGVFGFYLPQARDVLYTLDVSEHAETPGRWISVSDAGELARCVQKYLDLIFSTVNDGNLTVEKKAVIPYAALTGEFKGTLYTFAPSARDIQDLLGGLADTLEGDEYLAELLLARGNLGARRTLEDARELLAEAADYLRDIARETGKAVEDAGFQWTLGMEGKTVRQILINANGMSWGYETSGDEEDRDGRSFCFFTAREGSRARALLSGVTVRDGRELSGHAELDTGEGVMTFRFDCEPENVSPLGVPCGSFTFSAEETVLELRVGDAGDGSFDHTFSAEGVSVNVNVTGESTAAMPDAPTEDLSDYSPQELEELIYDMSFALGQDLGLDLEGILGGLTGGYGYGF